MVQHFAHATTRISRMRSHNTDVFPPSRNLHELADTHNHPLALLFIPIIHKVSPFRGRFRGGFSKLWFLYEVIACAAIFIIDATGIQDIPLFTEIIALCLLTRIPTLNADFFAFIFFNKRKKSLPESVI